MKIKKKRNKNNEKHVRNWIEKKIKKRYSIVIVEKVSIILKLLQNCWKIAREQQYRIRTKKQKKKNL